MFADRTRWNLTTNRLADALARARASGKKLLDLTASNPTECGFHYDRSAILAAFSNPAALEYHPDARGLKTAREAVAAYYAEWGRALELNDIFLTTSTSEAYSFVSRLLCNLGDELLVPAPSYPLFEFLADIQDVRLVRYPLIYDHGWQIDFHMLEKAITSRTRGVIVVNPNNPTGHFAKQAEIERLSELCAKNHAAIIADEVFLDFHLGPEHPHSLAANDTALTFTLSGVSKISGLPQMKLAWLIAGGPVDLKKEAVARLEIIADTYLSLSTPVQLAAPVLLDQRHGFQHQLMTRVRANLVELDARLMVQKNCSRLDVEGGWYVVLRVPATRSDEELAIELLEQHGVYVHPGHFYDFPGEGYLVVSLITPEKEFAKGIALLLEAQK